MRYGSSPAACGSFYYGEVEDYTVNITGTPSGLVATTTTIGFDAPLNQDLSVVGRFSRNGVTYVSTNIFSESIGHSRSTTFDVDAGTEIEWYAVYTGTQNRLLPSACSVVVGDTCRTLAGSVGEIVEFGAPAPPDPPTGDQTFDFEAIFGGVSYQAGPTFDLDGVNFSTTSSYFYNFNDAPFTSDYFAFGDVQMTFPAPVQSLSFLVEGRCTNCTQTVTVSADGVPVDTFTADKDVIQSITLSLPAGTTAVAFDQNLGIDDLAVDYE